MTDIKTQHVLGVLDALAADSDATYTERTRRLQACQERISALLNSLDEAELNEAQANLSRA